MVADPIINTLLLIPKNSQQASVHFISYKKYNQTHGTKGMLNPLT